MPVVAVFVVSSVEEFSIQCTDACSKKVNLTALADKGEVYKNWSKWTPSGNLTMMITNPTAAEFFVPGKKVHITFDEYVEE